MVERDSNVQHIYRWYDWEEEARGNDSFLVELCWNCSMQRGDTVDHAETPDDGEELQCEDCGALNDQAAIRRVGMFNHNLEWEL